MSANQKIVDGFDQTFEKIKSVDMTGLTRKGALDELLEKCQDPGFVNLLATNIVYDGPQGESVKWAINLDHIGANKNNLLGFPDNLETYNGPVLALMGGKSHQHSADVFNALFPDTTFKVIENAGHYLHFEAQDEVLAHVKAFLADL